MTVAGERFDAALRAIANFVDLKSPFMLGHANAVAELAARATAEHGLPELETTMRRAGLVHDLGRLGISNAIWDNAAVTYCLPGARRVARGVGAEHPARRRRAPARVAAGARRLEEPAPGALA